MLKDVEIICGKNGTLQLNKIYSDSYLSKYFSENDGIVINDHFTDKGRLEVIFPTLYKARFLQQENLTDWKLVKIYR